MNLLEQQLVEMGFRKPNPNRLEICYKYDLGRGRFLSAMCIGTGNEYVYLCHKDRTNKDINDGIDVIDDLVCVHNCDYDGKLSKEKMQYLINYFEKEWWW